MEYFENEDILHLAISDKPEEDGIAICPNITSELNSKVFEGNEIIEYNK